jgi:hypothetical protein
MLGDEEQNARAQEKPAQRQGQKDRPAQTFARSARFLERADARRWV